MSFSFATLGNDLYTGKRSVPVVPQRRRFYLASLVMIVIAVLGLVTQGLNLGLEFRGGSEFRVATSSLPGDYEQVARDAVGANEDERGVNVTLVGNDTVRVQTERLSDTDSQKVRADLARRSTSPSPRSAAPSSAPRGVRRSASRRCAPWSSSCSRSRC